MRSRYQSMTSTAQLHDCHSCYNERSEVQKKKIDTELRWSSIISSVGRYFDLGHANMTAHTVILAQTRVGFLTVAKYLSCNALKLSPKQ